jgi:hypothetical protein
LDHGLSHSFDLEHWIAASSQRPRTVGGKYRSRPKTAAVNASSELRQFSFLAITASIMTLLTWRILGFEPLLYQVEPSLVRLIRGKHVLRESYRQNDVL